MKKQFTISAAYQWSENGQKKTLNNSEIAIKSIIASINKRFNNKKHKSGLNYKFAYRRLRSSAGRTMLDSIIKRIESSQVVIVDISNPNPNVFIELGIALHVLKSNISISVYLIKETKEGEDFLKTLPSDLQGYFISTYSINGTKMKFNDNNSLRMSIVSDINDYYNKLGEHSGNIDEINFSDIE